MPIRDGGAPGNYREVREVIVGDEKSSDRGWGTSPGRNLWGGKKFGYSGGTLHSDEEGAVGVLARK